MKTRIRVQRHGIVVSGLLLGLLSGLHASAQVPVVGADDEFTSQDDFSYRLARDDEYKSYIEALDLSAEKKDLLRQHLTSKHQRQAALDAQAEKELGESYTSEVDLLVITYDQNSDHFRRREALRQEMDEQLRQILTDEERARHRRYKEVKALERSRRALRHQIENMELQLSFTQFDVALEVFEKRPVFFQQSPQSQGAAGYSRAYIVERERWRFEQLQDYLGAKLIPILNEEQVRRFQVWQEMQRVDLNRSLEMFEASEEFMARLYPERKRRIRMISPQELGEVPAKRPVYIECRNNELYLIPVDEIRRRASDTLKEIASRTRGNARSLMQELTAARVETDAYRADLTYALLAQLAIRPKRKVRGYALSDIQAESAEDWYGRIVEHFDPVKESMTFVVRDDSLAVFEKAKTLAEARHITVHYEILDPVATIKFALGGVPAIITDRPGERAPTQTDSANQKKPTYIDVYRDRVILYPGKTEVLSRDVDRPESPVLKLLGHLEEDVQSRYIVLLLREHSGRLASQLQAMARRRGIELVQQLQENGGGPASGGRTE